MKRYDGGSTVKGGYYWNLSTWEVTTIEGEAGVLPGPAEHKYLAVPAPLVFGVAPAMGGIYAFFLPALGFLMIPYAIARRLGVIGAKPSAAAAATTAEASVDKEAA